MSSLRCAVLLGCVVACAHEPAPARVEILPLPERAQGDVDASADDDPTCKPEPLAVVGPDATGALNAAALRERLAAAEAFAERCCTGDESGDVVVEVTLQPDGYDTAVELRPDLSETGPTRACVVATFRRVIAKAFRGPARTVTVPVHLK